MYRINLRQDLSNIDEIASAARLSLTKRYPSTIRIIVENLYGFVDAPGDRLDIVDEQLLKIYGQRDGIESHSYVAQTPPFTATWELFIEAYEASKL